jgi:hypothetical protein
VSYLGFDEKLGSCPSCAIACSTAPRNCIRPYIKLLLEGVSGGPSRSEAGGIPGRLGEVGAEVGGLNPLGDAIPVRKEKTSAHNFDAPFRFRELMRNNVREIWVLNG